MGKYSIDEADYKADQQICDRYIGFSSELLRLSLIAIGGYGALVTLFLKDKPEYLPALKSSWGLIISMILFCLCSGTTLVHRFFASDAMACYIRLLRLIARNDNGEQQKEKKELMKRLVISTRALIVAEFLFGFGVASFIYGFYQLLFIYSH